MHIGDYKVIVYENGAVDNIVLLRDDVLEVFTAGIVYVNGNNVSAWGLEVGVEIKDGADVCDKFITCVGIVEKFDERFGALDGAVIDSIFSAAATIYIKN